MTADIEAAGGRLSTRHVRIALGLTWCAAVGAAIYLYAIADATGTGSSILRSQWLIGAVTATSLVVGGAVSRREDWGFVGTLATIGSVLLFADLTRITDMAIARFGTMLENAPGTDPAQHYGDPSVLLGGAMASLVIATVAWFYFAATLWIGGAIRRQFIRAYDRLRRTRLPD
ncbi:MAG TPA: hypothetical protein VG247_28740 [Pseudonocardiaceae bacterium]|jgi:hypothetical protein|nr:hypothetical protein [Pseudonocardiaceae bacterium]